MCKKLIFRDGLWGQSYSIVEEAYRLDEPGDTPAGTCDPLCSVDEMSSEDFEESYKPNSDIIKAVVVGATVLAVAGVVNHSWVAENQASVRVLSWTRFWVLLLEDVMIENLNCLFQIPLMNVPDPVVYGCPEPCYVSGVRTWIYGNYIWRVSGFQQEWSRAFDGSDFVDDSEHWGTFSTSAVNVFYDT